jgi:hypothetical protein
MLYLTNGFQLWILIVLIVSCYFIILGKANFIVLERDKLKISYCGLLFWTDTIKVKDVLTVTSREIVEESPIDTNLPLLEFGRAYQLTFLDKKGLMKKLWFRIGNRKTEADLLAGIENARNKNI